MQFIFGCCPPFSYFLLLSIDMSIYPLLFIIVTASIVWTKYLPPNYNGSLPNFFSLVFFLSPSSKTEKNCPRSAPLVWKFIVNTFFFSFFFLPLLYS
jgi:hypothetical protein